MEHLPRLASLIFNQPHHITPEAAETILQAIGDRVGLTEIKRPEPEANAWTGRVVRDKDGRYSGYRLTEKGVAILSIQGELVNRGAWLGASSGLVSYEGLRQSLRNAASAREVKAIVLDVNSPGGMASGMLETAALVRQINTEKPVYAVSNGMMASAAYGISSGARAIIASDLGPVGSIGTLMMHVDRSKQLERMGLSVTLLHAGAHKVDGHPFSPLPDTVRSDIMERIEEIQTMFVNAVIEGRAGRVDDERVRATEARTFNGRGAVAAGIADDVGTFDAVVEEVENNLNRPASRVLARAQPLEKSMNLNTGGPAATNNQPGNGFEGMTIGEFNQAVEALTQSLGAVARTDQPAAATPAPAPAPAPASSGPTPVQTQPAETAEAAFARGRSEERARIKAILTHDAAQGRQKQAQVLALGSDHSPDQVAAMLKDMPTEQSSTGRAAQFYAAVGRTGGNPQVSHQGESEAGGYKSNLGGAMDRMVSRMPKPKGAAAS